MVTSIDFDSVLSLIDRRVKPYYLNSTQEIVLREVWNGKTYSTIAQNYNYDPEYIKTVGCNLWKTLSSAFNEPISKSNFVPLMRQKFSNSISTDEKNSLLEKEFQFINCTSSSHCYWTTAPNVKHFIGREKEIELLNLWSNDNDCNFVIVSGMVGCGKTSLITKFAKNAKDKFSRVIWLSLKNPLPLNKLVENCLRSIYENYDSYFDLKVGQQNLSLLLSQLVKCLQNNKILLLLDDLESILKIEDRSFCYRKEWEDYAYFLRCVVSTNHQSLLVCASRIKPKFLEYYGTNQVKSLDLQGLEKSNVCELFTFKDRQRLMDLSDSFQNNPQLLQIVGEHVGFWQEDISSIQCIIEELSCLETMVSFLEQELNCLSKREKEIVLWLAVFCTPVSKQYLLSKTTYFNSKIKFANSIQSLNKRSLVIEHDSKCSLMPIMKSYLRRKLIAQAL